MELPARPGFPARCLNISETPSAIQAQFTISEGSAKVRDSIMTRRTEVAERLEIAPLNEGEELDQRMNFSAPSGLNQIFASCAGRRTAGPPKQTFVVSGHNPGARLLWSGDGAQGRIRTTDTRIFSPLLYQLSYLGVSLPGGARESRRLLCQRAGAVQTVSVLF